MIRRRLAMWVLRRLWPESWWLLVETLAERAAKPGDVVVPAETIAAIEREVRDVHRAVYPRAVRHGRPIAELVSDLRLAKAVREIQESAP